MPQCDTWALRGVTPETRKMFQIAATLTGKNVGELANEVMSAAAHAVLANPQNYTAELAQAFREGLHAK